MLSCLIRLICYIFAEMFEGGFILSKKLHNSVSEVYVVEQLHSSVP
jgi:hypothetical protein